MTSHARSRPNGRNLIAQGEPLVWLTGGMFAIAITMIAALVGLILYQGLATLWPRPYVVFAQDDGGFASGEWIDSQPYRLSASGLTSFPEASQVKARELIGGKEAVNSRQLYLRTGNYDIDGKHFAYIPTVTLQSTTPQNPSAIWLVERLEWGVLYGFPVAFHFEYAPEMDSSYDSRKLFLEQLELYRTSQSTEPADEAIDPAVAAMSVVPLDELIETFRQRLIDDKSKLVESFLETSGLKELGVSTLSPTPQHSKSDEETQGLDVPSESATVHDIQKISTLTHQSYWRMQAVQRILDRKQHRLGHIDRESAELRLNVRKAELRENTDLLTTLDEGLEIAGALGSLRAQWAELNEARSYFEEATKSNTSIASSIGELSELMRTREEHEVSPWVAKRDEWLAAATKNLPDRSRRAVEKAIAFAESSAAEQLRLNQEIAAYDRVIKSESVEFAVPSLGESELASTEFPDSQSQGLVGVTTPEGTNQVAWRASPEAAGKLLKSKTVHVAEMVRWFEPNQLSFFGKLQVYFSRWFEFLFGAPREAGVEGGFFPAIWGTIVMTLLMSIAVMPFGVMAALYMREYAKSGWVLSLIRISINNLAGVPSIVYGVFGLAFFCYTVGGYIDGGPAKAGFEPWPPVTWFLTCAATVLAGTCAFFFAFLGSGSPATTTPLRKKIAGFAGLFWVACLIGFIALIVKIPFFDGFYQASLPNPTFGKGCLLWASCTLALLTLPVVIVATEEALSAVPNSLREGSYACGAGKWQTLQRIVLPYARPGIITGFILSMARGAGEVAPMMLVGAIPLATDLPLDLEFPFFHGSRSFMHLGFQIFSLGFQSQNSEAAKPMVFTATLLLLSIVTFLNVAAIWLRAQLRKRFQSSQF